MPFVSSWWMVLKNILDFLGSVDTAACCKCAVWLLTQSVNWRSFEGAKKKKNFPMINSSQWLHRCLFFSNTDFSCMEGSEQIQVHFNIMNYTVVFNFVFESPGFLFFQAVGTTIAEAISYTYYRRWPLSTVLSVVPEKAAALLRRYRKRRRVEVWSTEVCSCSRRKSILLVILSHSRTVCACSCSWELPG